MLIDTMFVYCPACGHDCLVETPPCADGHDSSCPDRVCLECGTALLTDVALAAVLDVTVLRPRHAA